ncbi:MAG TPA: hypothetical protein VKY81_12300 [Natronosporangium sp.]|nr:hypothetical protein [Natronosporangium sp.]
MFQRQQEPRTRAQMFREEMGQTVNHAMRAAGLAAGGLRTAGSQMAPAADRIRSAAARRWAEFNEAARMAGRMPGGMAGRPPADGEDRVPRGVAGRMARGVAGGRPGGEAGRRPRGVARGGRKAQQRRSFPRMATLIAGGAAVGMAAAALMRRRRQQWQEYPGRMMEPVGQAEGVGMEESAGMEEEDIGMAEAVGVEERPGPEPGAVGRTQPETGATPPVGMAEEEETLRGRTGPPPPG